MIKKDSKIYIAGHNGMVGSAIIRKLQSEGFSNLLTPRRDEVDCVNSSQQVLKFF